MKRYVCHSDSTMFCVLDFHLLFKKRKKIVDPAIGYIKASVSVLEGDAVGENKVFAGFMFHACIVTRSLV